VMAPPVTRSEKLAMNASHTRLVRGIAEIALLTGAYWAGAKLGLRLAFANRNVTAVWPPTGIAVSALCLRGRRVWPGIALGALLANVSNGAALQTASGIAVGNTLAPLLACTLLRRAVGFRTSLERLSDVVGLVVLGGLVSMLVSATLGSAALVLTGAAGSSLPLVWTVWWLGDALGVALFAPIFLTLLSTPPRSSPFWKHPTEAVPFLAGIPVIAYFATASSVPLIYLVVPVAIWGTLRFEQQGAAAAIAMVSGVSIWTTVTGLGPYVELSPTSRLVSVQVFNATLAVSLLVLATVVKEQTRSREVVEQSVRRLATMVATDPLTGLKNRREFDRCLAKPPRGPYALLAIDVDNLKWINDDHGHEAGDALLRAVGSALSGLVREGDVVARTGGDEFGVMLFGASRSETADIAERMRRAMHGVSVPYGRPRISIGWATADVDVEPAPVWKAADDRLYQAKNEGRDRSMGGHYAEVEPAAHRLEDREVLGRLLDTRVARAAFQPIVDLAERRTIGYEALLRPSDFQPTDSVDGVFRTAGLIGRTRDLDWLSRCVAVHDAQRLPQSVLLFLNVTPAFILNPLHEDVEQLLLLLRSSNRSAQTTVLEITEQERIHDRARLREVLSAHRDHGIRFSLDDMGDGHSALEVLAATDPEFIKVAADLTNSLTHSGRAAVKALVAFAEEVGAMVIAEGIEDDASRERMLGLGVSLGQGYLFGEPAWADQATFPARDRYVEVVGVPLDAKSRLGR
jgi:diguanylate cyclase (GGDEF)-like protein